MQGIIIENVANLYRVKTEQGVFDAMARGKFKQDDVSPVVGDQVEIEITDAEKKVAVIEKIFDRKNYTKRPKLANVTQMIFVVSSKNPKPDFLLLDKQLAYAEFLGLKVVIVFNKIDLDDKKLLEEEKAIYKKIGYPVVETKAKTGQGVQELMKLLQDEVNVFSGNSGVGKSTLINAIFGDDITQEGEVSKKNKRGKNTTTATKLYEIAENTYIADTPGFSTFEITELNSNDLAHYFREFAQEISNCEFVSCTHIKEEKCGIKEAILQGKISEKRYERFCKIYQELKQREERKW